MSSIRHLVNARRGPDRPARVAADRLDRLRGAILNGNRIVVLNGGSQELRFFDLEGRHVRTIGRKGGGPGEFQNAWWIAPYDGDSLVVYDFVLQRVSVFDSAGGFGRSFKPATRLIALRGLLADEAFVVLSTILSRPLGEMEDGPHRTTLGVIRVSADGQQVDTIGVHTGNEGVLQTSGRSRIMHTLPFGLSTYAAAGDSLIYVGSSDSWTIDAFDRNGTLRRSIRQSIERPNVTPEMIDRHRAAVLAEAPTDSARRASEHFLATVEYPDHLPAYGGLRVADDGRLWVQDYLVASTDSLRWSVFDASGRIMARATMPPGLIVDQIGSRFVLGRTRDDLDVEHVVLFELAREGTDASAEAGDP